jgi:DNA repair exonuclease SbcCD ATPase subunit
MVFGFGKKKIEESNVTGQKERTVTLQEIPGIIQGIELPRMTEVVSTANSVREEVEVNKKKIQNFILQLESDDLKLDDVDKNLGVIVKRGKDSVVSVIKKETTSPFTIVTKFDQAILLNSEINLMLKKIGDVLGLNSRIIHIFAKKYADNLKNEIAKVANSRNRLQSSINSLDNLRTSFQKIMDLVENVSEKRKEILQKNDRIVEIKSEIKTIKNIIISLEKQILDMKSDEGHAKFLEIKSKIDSMSSEKKNIKNNIDQQFTKISRSISKYSYISSFEKPIRKMMDELVSDPYEVISQQNKNTIIKILEAVAKSVSSGSISIKDLKKSLEQIQETISRLEEFISLKESYTNKVIELERNLTDFDIKLLESKEQELQKRKTEISNLEVIMKNLEIQVNDSDSSLIKHISDLESILSNLTNLKIILKIEDSQN